MKPQVYRFFPLLVSLFILLAISACTQETPTPVPFPTPNVHPIEEVAPAIAKWKTENNFRYSVYVDEIT